MLRRILHTMGVALTAVMLMLAQPTPAFADTLYMTIWWLRSDQESEPFSDEIRLRFANLGFLGVVAGWNDVDGGETHWYYSSSFGTPVNLPFTGDHSIDIMEDDSGGLGLVAVVPTFASEADQGPIEKRNTSRFDDGDYVIRYEIRTTPCC
jgi:hypothetical protein